MTGLERRLAALEATAPQGGSRVDLDAVSDADLAALERICECVERLTAGGLSREEAMSVLPRADLRLLTRLPVRGLTNGSK